MSTSTVYDGGVTKSKWKSSRDLTTYDKTKPKKEKKRKKPKGKLPKISQGLLDILNLNGDRVNNNSNHVSDSCIDNNPTTISIPVPIGIPTSSFSNKNFKNLVRFFPSFHFELLQKIFFQKLSGKSYYQSIR